MTELSCSLSIIGDGSVGKSTIINAFCSDGFQPIYKQTIGCDFYEKQLKLRGEIYVSLKLWDIGGQSISSLNLESYLKHSNSILLIYDVTNKESFYNLNDWLSKVKLFASNNNKVNIYLLGNKIDLLSTRQVTKKEHELFVLENQLNGSLFTSAKTGENIVKMFYKIASESINMKLTEYELGFYDKVLTVHIDNNSSNQQDMIRNKWADEIEKEDLKAIERNKNKSNCQCITL